MKWGVPRGWGAGMAESGWCVALFFIASLAAHRTYPSLVHHLSSLASASTDVLHA